MLCIRSLHWLSAPVSFPNARHLISASQHASRRYGGSVARPSKPNGNALALELFKKNGYDKRKGAVMPKGDRSRLNIVSESLCHDIIERLSSSLAKHKNCDIIDVNPGLGLWSSKLHEAIKPRTHLLMEPDTDIYLPYLKPLAEKKDSTFKLIPKSGILWENLNALESENHLPNQKLYPKGDERLKKPNDSLLFIANLGYYPNKMYNGFPSVTLLMVHQLLSAIRNHSIFQGYGLVRMLVWMRDREKKVVFPRVISQRRKFSVEAEITCENIYEIAGSDEMASTWRREHRLDLEGSRRVLTEMLTANIQTPRGRVGKSQEEAAQKSSLSIDSGSGVVRPFLKELEEMEARYARREFCSHYDDKGEPVYLDPGTRPKRLQHKSRTPEYNRLQQLRYRLNQVNSSNDKLDHLLAEYESIITEQIKVEGVDTIVAKQSREALQDRLVKWNADVERQPSSMEPLLWQRIDDRRAFYQNPPILLWDRRKTEPLKVVNDDFFPQQEMCLLDFQPRALWPVFQGKKLSNYDYFDFIVAALFINPTHSVVRGLKSLAPGAADWILPRCPSLANTAEGGVMDLEQLRIRALNQEMLKEIMDAWMEWPFRPTKAEMIVRTGNQNAWSGEEDELDLATPGQ